MTLLSLDILDPTDAVLDWWSEVPALKTLKRVDFKPGLNVLFAPNGYGKSTVLKAIAAVMHCLQGGPPVFTGTSIEPWARGRGRGVRLTHDGGLCFYADPAERPGLIGGMAGFDSDFFADGVLAATARASSGEWCTRTINRIIGLASTTKEWGSRLHCGRDKLPQEAWHKGWSSTQVVQPGEGKPTVLLDEFDRSLDLPMVQHTWALFAVHAPKRQQLIIAGHHPIVLKLADRGLCHLIDLCPGYVKACREAETHLERYLDNPSDLTTMPRPFVWRQVKVPEFERPRRPSKAR